MRRRVNQVPERTHDEHAAKAREYLRGTSLGAHVKLDPGDRIALANTHATLALYELLLASTTPVDGSAPNYMDAVLAARR